MKKYLLTMSGFAAFYAELQQYDEERLFGEAEAFAADPIVYLTERFEVDVLRLEAIIGFSQLKVKALGYYFASLMITGESFELKAPLLSLVISNNIVITEGEISITGSFLLERYQKL